MDSYPSNRFQIQGRIYTLIAVTKVGKNKFIHTVKNDRGDYKDLSDPELQQFTINATWLKSTMPV